MYLYAEEGGTLTPYMGAHCRHLANTISHLNYLLILSRFKSLYFHFCETALNSYRFIHQISEFKFDTFSLRFALNSFSARHQICHLKRD